jgi:hypothetical protein
MQIEVKYYALKSDKSMGDGSIIPQGQDLMLVRHEDDKSFFETVGDDCKKLFWASEEEVEFIKSELEEWEDEDVEERNNYTSGKFL